MTDAANKICRCMKDHCADCMERYRKASDDLARDMLPGGRIHRKLKEIRESVDQIVAKREGKQMTSPEDDPEYRIAYDVDRCKVGCVLIQAALACDVPSDLFYAYFGTGDAWTIHANGCQVYPIRRSQLPVLAARTNFKR